MPGWLATVFQIWGIASAAACGIVVAVVLAALLYDRRQHGRWAWRDGD